MSYNTIWECSFTAKVYFRCGEFHPYRAVLFFFLLGYSHPLIHPYDFLILHMKQYIYNCKRNDHPPALKEFLISLSLQLPVECSTPLKLFLHRKQAELCLFTRCFCRLPSVISPVTLCYSVLSTTFLHLLSYQIRNICKCL